MQRFLKLLSLCALIFCASPVSLFAASLDQTFVDFVRAQGLSSTQQAACAADRKGSVLSHNAAARIIPASVSKLYTFDFALASLPEDFRYRTTRGDGTEAWVTTFTVVGDTLYINGGGDPHFVIGHLRSVIEKIYRERGVVLKKFVISPDFYFNWQSNQKDVQLSVFNSLKADRTLPIAPRISVAIAAAPYSAPGYTYTFESMPLPALLKQINDYSTNISADTLFRRLGGSAAFAAYMKKEYGVGTETISFATGSGLAGNYTTCELTLRVVEHLAQTLEDRGLRITDVLSMPTVDPGVLQKRLFSEQDARALVAKSGFLNYHHALAGAINTRRGLSYFAVFTYFPTMKKSDSTKAMIDRFVTELIASYGRTIRPFDYEVDLTLFESFKIRRGKA